MPSPIDKQYHLNHKAEPSPLFSKLLLAQKVFRFNDAFPQTVTIAFHCMHFMLYVMCDAHINFSSTSEGCWRTSRFFKCFALSITTLALAKFAGRRFLQLVTKFAEEIARRRCFRVHFIAFSTSVHYITYYDVAMTAGAHPRIQYTSGNQASLVAACQEVSGKIGAHAVAEFGVFR